MLTIPIDFKLKIIKTVKINFKGFFNTETCVNWIWCTNLYFVYVNSELHISLCQMTHIQMMHRDTMYTCIWFCDLPGLHTCTHSDTAYNFFCVTCLDNIHIWCCIEIYLHICNLPGLLTHSEWCIEICVCICTSLVYKIVNMFWQKWKYHSLCKNVDTKLFQYIVIKM